MAIDSESAIAHNLKSLSEALSSATECVLLVEALQPPTEGLSLLDVKNELLLSYIQNLVFLILFKIRNHNCLHEGNDGNTEPSYDDIVKNLVSLRLYLEKGVRPLESRLKYQLDKLLLAASEAEPKHQPVKDKPRKSKRSSSASSSTSASETEAPISDLSHRPNLSAFTRPRASSPSTAKPNSSSGSNPNIYRPPRITPTALPTTDRPNNPSARKRKNQMLDTFVAEELSSAPIAEPSIGTGPGLRGRDAEKERERREYEELRL
ncbi:MAG: hypothetical protein Q9179_006348, partial [Wetmoreana sp. 5 TL-2023]